jgi:hypothetical protein
MNRPTPQPYHADDQRQRHRELARHQHPAQTSALGAAASCFSQRVMDAHARRAPRWHQPEEQVGKDGQGRREHEHRSAHAHVRGAWQVVRGQPRQQTYGPAGQDDAEGAAEHGEHQDHCMDDGEDRRGRADAERQREDDDRRAGGAAQRPEGEADVFESVGLDRV